MKSRTSSAFLAFIRNLLISLLWGAGILIFEISSLNLWEVLHYEVGHWQLWFFPIAVFCFVFLYRSFKKPVMKLAICLIAISSLLLSLYFRGVQIADIASAYILDLKISQQKNVQKSTPLYPNSVLLTEEPLLVYWVDDEKTSETLNSEQLETTRQFIESLPEILTQYSAAVYLMEDSLFLQNNSDIASLGEVFGVSSTLQAASCIRVIFDDANVLYTYLKDGSTVFLNDPIFFRETIVHELAHLLDYYSTGIQDLLSESEEFNQFYEEDPDLFGDYGASAREEYFAEASVFYFLYPDLMKQIAPDIYQFFLDRFPYQEEIQNQEKIQNQKSKSEDNLMDPSENSVEN
ncbi:anthrax toxin lethal factor-related metalloendopeptidase [Ileibacterium valens]|uniref:anthrax toxin lethal factor-related metalloendopeptidase n=1 Tax=Ileibacterium valens TaxID=1862668 RepID=UPI002573670E|nr:hypothetical protein [Ileibacterium valens]